MLVVDRQLTDQRRLDPPRVRRRDPLPRHARLSVVGDPRRGRARASGCCCPLKFV